MTAAQDSGPTELIIRWREGDESSRDDLFAMFYPRLRASAEQFLRGERHVSLSPGDLVHEAVARIVSTDSPGWTDRTHFLAVASKVMRHVMVDHVRAKGANKRHHQKITLVPDIVAVPDIDFSELHEHLVRLAAIDPDKAEIVEYRFFGGMTIEEVAEVQGKSPVTIKRHWAIARAWLVDALEADA